MTRAAVGASVRCRSHLYSHSSWGKHQTNTLQRHLEIDAGSLRTIPVHAAALLGSVRTLIDTACHGSMCRANDSGGSCCLFAKSV